MDDAIRNLIRQGKIEQVYSYMQTGTRRGMQTMEQSLLELVQKRTITVLDALGRSSRPGGARLRARARRYSDSCDVQRRRTRRLAMSAALRVAGS